MLNSLSFHLSYKIVSITMEEVLDDVPVTYLRPSSHFRSNPQIAFGRGRLVFPNDREISNDDLLKLSGAYVVGVVIVLVLMFQDTESTSDKVLLGVLAGPGLLIIGVKLLDTFLENVYNMNLKSCCSCNEDARDLGNSWGN